MPLTRVKSAGVTNNAIGSNQLDLTANYAFTGTVSGAGLAQETGTWTPAISGMGSPSTQVGIYIKIGKLVTAHCHMNGVVSGSGTVTVSGLPYPANSTTNMQQSITLGFISHVYFTSGSMLGVTARMNPGRGRPISNIGVKTGNSPSSGHRNGTRCWMPGSSRPRRPDTPMSKTTTRVSRKASRGPSSPFAMESAVVPLPHS